MARRKEGRMTELAVNGDRRMTVREVADALGVDPRTIQLKVKELFPEIVEERKTTLLDESQVTAVKIACEKKFAVQTRLEKALLVRQALLIQQEAIAELEVENAELRAENAELKPKAETLDKMTATDNDISVRELAAILAVPHLGQNNLFERLRTDGYIDSLNRPYRQYIEAGLMYEKEYYVPQMDATKRQLRITQKGAAHFAAKYAPCRAARRERAGELFISPPAIAKSIAR
jgi:phage antirepressor YoqD-like protein